MTRVRLALAILVASAASAMPGAQVPTFRSAVSLVAVDVQVVTHDGQPITTLGPSDFKVSIGGRARRLVSSDLIRHDARQMGLGGATHVATHESWRGRQVVVAIDTGSFEAGAWQRTVPALREFLLGFGPDDDVALVAYPSGPVITPSRNHVLVSQSVARIVPRGAVLRSQFNLRPAEIVDIVAESVVLNSPGTASLRTRQGSLDGGMDARTVQRVQLRECPNDADCAGRILLDAANAVQDLEARAVQSLAGLESMLRTVATWPGRKAIVLVSGGVTVSDRPGGRPDAGSLSRTFGAQIAMSNAVVYTLHVDTGFQDTYSASSRRLSNPGFDQTRETEMQGRWLDQFSDAAGGTLLRVQADQGEAALSRVLRETSAFYLLAVEPEAADRDGRLRELRVEVNRRGATVRSRRWVSVPAERR